MTLCVPLYLKYDCFLVFGILLQFSWTDEWKDHIWSKKFFSNHCWKICIERMMQVKSTCSRFKPVSRTYIIHKAHRIATEWKIIIVQRNWLYDPICDSAIINRYNHRWLQPITEHLSIVTSLKQWMPFVFIRSF